MKTKGLRTLLASVTALSLVGTGYAAWQFSKDATATFTGNVVVTEKADEVGTLTLKSGETVKLVLDQNEAGGVYWANTSGTEISTITLEFKGTERVVDETITVSGEATSTGKLSDYVTIGTFADVSHDWVGGLSAVEYEFTLPTVAYTAAYPLNETAYDKMVTDLSGAQVTFTFTAEVAECTHA